MRRISAYFFLNLLTCLTFLYSPQNRSLRLIASNTIAVDWNLKWPLQIYNYIKELSRLYFQENDRDAFRFEKTIFIFVYQLVFPLLLACDFCGFIEGLFRGLSIICGLSSIPLKELSTKLCDRHPSACVCAQKILSIPSHLPQHNCFSKCRSHAKTCSVSRLISSRINSCKNSTILYLVRILTKWERIVTDFLYDLS